MAKLTWDNDGARLFETGVEKVVLYVWDDDMTSAPETGWKYSDGVAWNGVSSVNDSPDGGDATDIWANDKKYLSLRAAENCKGSISAYMYPDEWEECDGCKVVEGTGSARLFKLHQQSRKRFALCYKTLIGNDTEGVKHGYILHFIYGATASPASRDHATSTDSPEATEMSWDFETTPPAESWFLIGDSGSEVQYDVTAHVEINSLDFTGASASKLSALESYCYGTDGQSSANAKCPSPKKIYTLLTT